MALYTDDFNRANGAIGSPWTSITGTWAISSNKAAATGGGDAQMRYNNTVGNDQWAEADVVIASTGGNSAGVGVRLGTGTSTPAYYSWCSSDGLLQLWKRDGSGNYTKLSGDISTALSFKVRVEAEGTTVRLFKDDVQVFSTTDSTATAGQVGLFGGNYSGTVPTIDNWRGGDMPYTPVGGGPGTWTGNAATVTVTGTSSTWSYPGMPTSVTWTDTDFVNINSGGDYETTSQFGMPSFQWQTGTAGQITSNFGRVFSRRLDAATSLDQYVKTTVSNVGGGWALATHAPSPPDNRQGYWVEKFDGTNVYWWYNGADHGLASVGALGSSAGTVELRVVAEVAKLYINGTLRSTKDFSAQTALTSPYQMIVGDDSINITDAEGGDYGAGQAWTGTAGTIGVAGTDGTWLIVGGPQTWTGGAATVSVAGTSSAWSVPSVGPWVDTDFININSGGDYETVPQFAGDLWGTGTAGQIEPSFGFGRMYSRRLTAADTDNQFVRITVVTFAGHNIILQTHCPAPWAERAGYTLEYRGAEADWYVNNAYAGTSTGYTQPSGGGTLELRVINNVATVYANGALLITKTFATAALTGRPYQVIAGSGDNFIITHATGGDYATPRTWAGFGSGTIQLVGDPSSRWSGTGPQSWFGAEGTASVAGTAGAWAQVVPLGFRFGAAYAADLKFGTADVPTAYMGGRRVWPPPPLVWTGTAATVAVAGSTAIWYTPGAFVFYETFASGLTNWVPSRWRTEFLHQPPDPGHVGYSDGIAGNNGVVPPNDIVVVGNRLWIGCGSQNYGDAILRCLQPFNFGASGVIEVDAVIPNVETLDGWTQVMVTSLPYTSPSALDYNAVGSTPKYGFTVRLNYGATGPSRPCPVTLVWNNHIETGPISGGIDVTTSRTDPTTVRIEFTHSHINVFANGTLWYSANWTLPPELTSGFLYIGVHNHASFKYVGRASTNGQFAGVRFDGIPATVTQYRKVPDANISHSGGVDIGWVMPVNNLVIPNVPASPTNPRLLCSTSTGAHVGNYSTWRLQYRLNGGTQHSVPFEPGDRSWVDPNGVTQMVWPTVFSIPVDPAELVVGSNTVSVTGVGFPLEGYAPYIGNIQLVYT